nr:hypothetical protein [Tanacetum cinerariifolium]
FVGNDGREVFGMPIPDALLTDAILGAPYYGRYWLMSLSINDIWMENRVWQLKKQYPNLLLPKL